MVLEYLPEFDTVLVPTGAVFALRVFGFILEGFTGDLPLFVDARGVRRVAAHCGARRYGAGAPAVGSLL